MSMFESCPGSHEGDSLCSIDPGVQVHRTEWTRYSQMYCFEQLYIIDIMLNSLTLIVSYGS